MSASRCAWLALGIALAMNAGAALGPENARAETGADAPSTNATSTLGGNPVAGGDTGLRSTIVDDCGGRAGVLGVSRVVEIDTATGPEFGDQYLKTEPKFLEPGEVVLTFDDGPMRRYTRPILDALDEQCVKATFFSVGRMAISDPATLQEVARRGHTIGTHTWSHKNLATLSATAMKREFELGLSAVSAAAGVPIAPFFRFPYLGHSKATRDYIRSRGVGIFGIHVDSKDFRTKSPGIVLRTVLGQLEREKKGILLFHDIQPSTAGALSSLLDELRERGFKVVHMVAKQPLVTLPEYDAIAEKSLKAKSVSAASTPLADRAATWPISDAEPAAAAAAPPPKASKAPARPFDWANPSNDPWMLKSFGNE